MEQTTETQATQSLRDVFTPDFARCGSCGEPLKPQKRTCQACGNTELPFLMQSLWLVALVAAGVFGVIGIVFRMGDTDRHLLVAIAGGILCGLSLLFALILRQGKTDGWYAWTVILGLAIAAAAMMLMIVLGDSHKANPMLTYVYLGITIGYLGWMWRTTSQGLWAVASTAYVLLTAVFSIWMAAAHADHELVILVVGFGLIMIVTAVLFAIAYAVPVRWWHNVGLGWQGGKIVAASQGEEVARPDNA